ncbi:ABC transporter ATP-binding protein [Streptomyces flaveus]|uniref:ABC transporter ATP-binding protein n=1 Tax=Streptomyces flaveus TaxID=66370 RepID=A0A917R0A9_9ACTN|nr:ATP-binding cassette domain-containing protein [Streptomyces flaveus]GGK79495.1 ABC transporter ATP-binding protein [Streptomyces flaveus]
MSGSIEVRGLSRTFHTTVRRPGFLGAVRSLVNPERVAKHAVTDISFEVQPGELLALLGPNGAGKSTTIKMLTGILTPTAGEARVVGTVPYEERERNARNIGAVFGQRTQLWWDLPVRESFAILRDIYDVPADEHASRLREFDDLLDLSSFWDTRVRHLSLGQRVRSDLAAALLHDPPVVFLDEPTIGMDVVVKEQVREFLRYQVEERGRTVLLTTHDMTEVERLAERVVLINHGRLVLDGTLDEIRRKFGSTWQVRATLADGHAPVEPWPGVVLVRRDGPQVVFGPDGPAAPTVHQALKQVIERYEVTDIALDEAELEDVMRAAYVQAGDMAADMAGDVAGDVAAQAPARTQGG